MRKSKNNRPIKGLVELATLLARVAIEVLTRLK